MNNSFFYFFTLSLLKEKKRYMAIVIISTLLIFLLSSTLFISSSIKASLNSTLKAQPDFVVQKLRGGELTPLDISSSEKIMQIFGVSKVAKRVYGRYFFDEQKSALIIGIDILDEQSSKNLSKIVNNIDLREFLNGDNMIVSKAVKEYLSNHYYKNSYSFLNPKGKIVKVNIFNTLKSQTSLLGNDVIIMPLNLAQKVLGLNKSQITDITLNVPNDSEWDNIKLKLQELDFNLRIVTKKQMKEFYENLFNYKGGIFLILYLIVIVTFSLLLYLRYSLATSIEKKEIAILRSIGWSIKDVLKLKFFENIFIVFFASILGAMLGYIYVFIFGAPLLKEIFLSGDNLKIFTKFTPVVDFSVLATIFIIFAVTFLASVLIPIWKVAITSPREVLN